MRKGSAHLIAILIVGLVAIGALLYLTLLRPKEKPITCCEPKPLTSSSKLAPTPAESINGTALHIEAGEFIVDVPRSWARERVQAYDEYYDYLYSDLATGDYVRLTSQNYPNIGRGADTAWVYSAAGQAPYTFVPGKEIADCKLEDSMPYCMDGDNKLMINVSLNGLPDSFRPVYIEFGNTKSETADRQVYRDILKTLKIRSGYELKS